MNFFRTHIIGKTICFLFALHILNVSVNPLDVFPDWTPEDLSINKMESITEIIFEEVLHIDNAFPEQDDQINGAHSSHAVQHLVMAYYHQLIRYIYPISNFPLLHNTKNENQRIQIPIDILTPPPKA
jgi:hypothetical protein